MSRALTVRGSHPLHMRSRYLAGCGRGGEEVDGGSSVLEHAWLHKVRPTRGDRGGRGRVRTGERWRERRIPRSSLLGWRATGDGGSTLGSEELEPSRVVGACLLMLMLMLMLMSEQTEQRPPVHCGRPRLEGQWSAVRWDVARNAHDARIARIANCERVWSGEMAEQREPGRLALPRFALLVFLPPGTRLPLLVPPTEQAPWPLLPVRTCPSCESFRPFLSLAFALGQRPCRKRAACASPGV